MEFENVVDPLTVLEEWIEESRAEGAVLPEAMTLATVTEDGWPAARVVLLKGREGRQLWFFTNYESPKAKQLQACPRAELVMHHAALAKQVRVRGSVEKLAREQSETYFATRPRESQIGAWASEQSRPVPSRTELEQQVSHFERKFAGQPVPCPPHWGGFALRAERVELWVGRSGRLHDRASYSFGADGVWTCRLLQP